MAISESRHSDSMSSHESSESQNESVLTSTQNRYLYGSSESQNESTSTSAQNLYLQLRQNENRPWWYNDLYAEWQWDDPHDGLSTNVSSRSQSVNLANNIRNERNTKRGFFAFIGNIINGIKSICNNAPCCNQEEIRQQIIDNNNSEMQL